jgi:hypothetical protein
MNGSAMLIFFFEYSSGNSVSVAVVFIAAYSRVTSVSSGFGCREICAYSFPGSEIESRQIANEIFWISYIMNGSSDDNHCRAPSKFRVPAWVSRISRL